MSINGLATQTYTTQVKSTLTTASDKELPFMDVRVHRNKDGTFTRSVYRKPTFTGLYTRWDSFCATYHKIGLLRSLTHRAMKICSPSTLKEEFGTLTKIFTDNGYPMDIIERTIRSVRNQPGRIGIENIDDRKIVNIRLPWIGQDSKKFEMKIKRAIKQAYPDVRTVVAFSTQHAFSGIAKDALPTKEKSSVVYMYTCCCKQMYVGRTVQRLSERIKQHIPEKIAVKTCGTIGASTESAITRHLRENRKCIKEPEEMASRFEVIAYARNTLHLQTLEALYIRSRSPSLCRQKEHVSVIHLS